MSDNHRPWPALWALCLGFFMILVDTTIVSVATPAIMTALDADIGAAVWVTSGYLLAYAVPLLVTGRMGDRFGPKRIYLIGLVVFTLTSAWCSTAATIEALILARVFQGLGAALMTPQTMAIITRMFHPDRRGAALGVWGAVAGLATLTGPLLGGALVSTVGWEAIFYINIPIGIAAFVLVSKLVPRFDTHRHRFDWLGVVLSATAMFCLVFGLQEGETHGWGELIGPVTVTHLVLTGGVLLAGFLTWQALNRAEPLLPLGLFADRNFALASLAIACVSFTVTAMALPLMLFAQDVRGLSAAQAALLMVPMAVVSGAMAAVVGRLVDRTDPKYVAAAGTLVFGVALFWLGAELDPQVPLWRLCLPIALVGLGSAGVWAPLSTTATRNLPPHRAGAGSGVYNTMRQIGAVLGSAAIAAAMQWRIAANGTQQADTDPGSQQSAFATAMGESVYLPGAVILVAFVATLCFQPRRDVAPADASTLAEADSARS